MRASTNPRPQFTRIAALLAAGVALSPGAARAEEEATKRPMPEYDGRESPPTTLGDVALFVPRAALFPVYLVSEYVVRRPFEWLVVNAEKGQWPTLVLDFFTFGEERKVGVFPSALVDFGFRPSVGVYSFWDDFIFDRNGVRLYLATGGRNWYSVRVADKVKLPDDAGIVSLAVGATRRPDFRFEGIGARASDDFLARYRADRLDTRLSYDSPIGDAGNIFAFAGARRVLFREGACCNNVSIDDQVETMELSERPPGFDPETPYAVYAHGLEVNFDTRRPRPAPGDGFRLELLAEQAFDLEGTLKSPWVRYGGAVGGFLDAGGDNRVLSLFVSTELIDPTDSDGIIPFTELLTLGGAGALPGFREGTLLGRSNVAAKLEYRWPIWVWLDGAAHFAVGNVFDERLEDFEWDLLRMSFGIGMRTLGRRDHSFNMLVAFGTETFENGAEITSFRFVLGTNRGF